MPFGGHANAVESQDIVKQCRFRTRTCFKCGKRGHLQSVCKSTTQKSKEVNREKHIEEDKATSSDNDFALWTVTGGHREGYHVHLRLNGKPVQMELDTGGGGCCSAVISEHEWTTLFSNIP